MIRRPRRGRDILLVLRISRVIKPQIAWRDTLVISMITRYVRPAIYKPAIFPLM
jgi:hypothetical protein